VGARERKDSLGNQETHIKSRGPGDDPPSQQLGKDDLAPCRDLTDNTRITIRLVDASNSLETSLCGKEHDKDGWGYYIVDRRQRLSQDSVQLQAMQKMKKYT
jgi:hypothetical protein